jgi:cell division transport system permease protein
VIVCLSMIRQGIYHNRDQIKTLRLLGAPDGFIGFQFVLVGFLLTFGGGLLAAVLITILINRGYGQLGGTLPFIPLPSRERLLLGLVTLLLSGSAALGILGSLFGLSSINKESQG